MNNDDIALFIIIFLPVFFFVLILDYLNPVTYWEKLISLCVFPMFYFIAIKIELGLIGLFDLELFR